MQAQVAVFGTLRFPEQNIESLLPHLQQLVSATKQFDGCLLYEVALDPFDKGLIRFSELWPDRQTLEQHLLADHIEPWRLKAKQYGLLEREFVSYDINGQSTNV